MVTIQFDVFYFSFIFFIILSQTISVINRSGMCYFLHVSNYWHICWCVHVLLHTSIGKDCNREIKFKNFEVSNKHVQLHSMFLLYLSSPSPNKVLLKWKKFFKFVSHKKSEKITKFKQYSYKLELHKFYTGMQKIFPYKQGKFAHAFFKLSGNTRRIFIKLLESHYFSYLITF